MAGPGIRDMTRATRSDEILIDLPPRPFQRRSKTSHRFSGICSYSLRSRHCCCFNFIVYSSLDLSSISKLSSGKVELVSLLFSLLFWSIQRVAGDAIGVGIGGVVQHFVFYTIVLLQGFSNLFMSQLARSTRWGASLIDTTTGNTGVKFQTCRLAVAQHLPRFISGLWGDF